MVTASGLRLGNYIVVHGVLHVLDLDLLTVILHNDIHIEGLPLTPEILEKAGFATKHASEYWQHFILNNNWYISQWISDKQLAGFEKKGIFYWSDDYIEIEYLHQLQNIYFALTRNELEISI